MGHEDQTFVSLCILNHLIVVLMNLFYQLIFFSIKGKGSFLCGCCFIYFVGYIFYPM